MSLPFLTTNFFFLNVIKRNQNDFFTLTLNPLFSLSSFMLNSRQILFFSFSSSNFISDSNSTSKIRPFYWSNNQIIFTLKTSPISLFLSLNSLFLLRKILVSSFFSLLTSQTSNIILLKTLICHISSK